MGGISWLWILMHYKLISCYIGRFFTITQILLRQINCAFPPTNISCIEVCKYILDIFLAFLNSFFPHVWIYDVIRAIELQRHIDKILSVWFTHLMQVETFFIGWVGMLVCNHVNWLPKHDILMEIVTAAVAELIKWHFLRIVAIFTKVFENQLDQEIIRNLWIFLEVIRTSCELCKVNGVNLRNERSVNSCSANQVIVYHSSVLKREM